MTSEFEARLADIRSGPWRKQSLHAREQMPTLSPHEIYRHLRSHYEDPNGISDPDDIAFRESFDDLLEELQLLELAVESNYLPLDVVRPVAMEEFETFLLPHVAARAYLQAYDFILVRFLAERLGLDLRLEHVATPPINPGAAVRYASFLAANSEFSASTEVCRFTMLIDDYIFAGTHIDAPYLKRYLAAPETLAENQENLVGELCQGLFLFVQILGDFFIQVDQAEQSLFGCAFAYWLGHFFGVRRVAKGFQDYGPRFGNVTPADSLFGAALARDELESERKRFVQRVATLRTTWVQTRALLESLG